MDGRELQRKGRRALREAWATCVHEAGHALVAITLGYDLAFSDVSEVLAWAADGAAKESSIPRTGFTRIFQSGRGSKPAIAFAVAGRAAEVVHELIEGLHADEAMDVARWVARHWDKDDDLKDAYTKAAEEVGGSEQKAWMRVQRDFGRTVKLLGTPRFRAATLEIASLLMRDGRVQAAAIHRIAARWSVSRAPGTTR